MNKKNPNPNNKNTHKNPPPQQTTQTHHTTIIVPLLKMWIPGYFIMMDWLKPALEHPHSCLFPSPALPALWDGGENEKSIRERAHRLTWGYFNKWKKEEKEQVVQRRSLTTSPTQTDAQPVSEPQVHLKTAFLPAPLLCPSFHCQAGCDVVGRYPFGQFRSALQVTSPQ